MKILNLKNVMSVLTCLALTLAVAAPSVTYAGDKGKHKHLGWCKDYKGQGQHKGWTDFHEKQCPSVPPSGGEEWTVTIQDLAVNRGDQMVLIVNSLTTVQDVLDTAAGGSAPDGVNLHDCFYDLNCGTNDTVGPLDPNLSLEASSVENEEVLYLLMEL